MTSAIKPGNQMPRVRVIVGLQFGDEGKGKKVDQESSDADLVVRYGGGNNAGHTVMVVDPKSGQRVPMALHLLPAAVARANVQIAIGVGAIVDPFALINEVDHVGTFGFQLRQGLLTVDSRCALVTIANRVIDMAQETVRSRDGQPIGTTARGIGPTYAALANRTAIKVTDLFRPECFSALLRQRLEETVQLVTAMGITPEQWQHIFVELSGKEQRANQRLIELGLRTTNALDYTRFASGGPTIGFNVEALEIAYRLAADRIGQWHCVGDVSTLIRQAVLDGKRILFEGAQGAMLDLHVGSWPFVTSSHPLAGGACTGTGVGPTLIQEVIGVAKGYVTRVGNGPFPTKITDPGIAAHLKNRGNEFGASTGRPRDVGWFDAVMARSACWWNHVRSVSLLKLDVMSGLEQVKICTNYSLKGRRFDYIPDDHHQFNDPALEPEYLILPGWQQDISGVRQWSELPIEVRRYVGMIEELLNEGMPQHISVNEIGVGPGADEYVTH